MIEVNFVLYILINDNLEQQAKLLYDYWFTQFDFPDENGKPYRISGGKMVWNEQIKRDIPEGWEVKSLTEILQKNTDVFQVVDKLGKTFYFDLSIALKSLCNKNF